MRLSVIAQAGLSHTLSTRPPGFVVVGIGLVKRMALGAVSFGSVETTSSILLCRNWFEMIRVHAVVDSTKVIESQPFWDWTLKKFVRKSVGAYLNSLLRAKVFAKSAIAMWVNSTCPQPASFSFIYSPPETNFVRQCFVQEHSSRHAYIIAVLRYM